VCEVYHGNEWGTISMCWRLKACLGTRCKPHSLKF
jgi:hypothetical protein